MIKKQELMELTEKTFINHGLQSHIAKTIADVLVHANMRGVDSHGVLRVEHYIKRINSGGVNINSNITEYDTSQTTSILDGDNGFGHYISKKAMDSAISKANNEGIGAVAVKNSSHCGALSYFVQQAANQNLIGIAMTHADKIVVPFGGKEQFFGTNPIAFGFPTNEDKPLVLDFATSTVSLGKILNERENGGTIPDGWGVDKYGKKTNDPHEVVSLTPFGGPKGYGLAMVVEIFTSMLTGAAFGPHITQMYNEYYKNQELGHFFIAVDPEKFVSVEIFKSRLNQMMNELRQVAPEDNVDRIFVPGELEMINEKHNEEYGIDLQESVYNYLKKESES